MSGQVVQGGSALRRAIHATTQVLAFLAVLSIAVMLVAIVADVTRRTLAGQSVKGVVELGEVMMVVIVFLGLGFAERRGAHVTMTLLVRRLPTRVAAVVNGLGLLLVVVVVGWMVLVTADRALASFEVREFRFGLVRVPVWPARIAIAVGLAAYLLELVIRLIDDTRAALGKGPGPAVEDPGADVAPLI
ncbi:MAG: TRAP transporter small permease subunit [Nocardioidaceae bacterium]